jgi:hypothetical protein
MNKAETYISTEYHYSPEEFSKEYGSELIDELKNSGLEDPQNAPDEQIMKNRINNFFTENNWRRKRRKVLLRMGL